MTNKILIGVVTAALCFVLLHAARAVQIGDAGCHPALPGQILVCQIPNYKTLS
jgi:hypothetical protein